MSAGDKSQKTEPATPEKKRKAKQEGQIPRSQELVAWTSLLVMTLMIRISISTGTKSMQKLMDHTSTAITNPTTGTAMKLLGEGLVDTAIIIAPLVLGTMFVGVVGNLSQTGFILSGKGMVPKLSRLNPFKGMKRLFNAQGRWEAVKAVIKVVLLTGLAWYTLREVSTTLATGGPFPLSAVIKLTADATLTFVRQAATAGLVLAGVDYLINRRRMNKDLMMTKDEVKQESKNSEGNPLVKGAIRQKARQMSMNRMMSSIPDADVVVINPIHFAVALKYDAAKGAPRVVAKGAGHIATKIREIAEENNVPLVEDIPLARTLHKFCEINQEIPPNLFEAVARLLAFIFALKAKSHVSRSGVHKPPVPLLPAEMMAATK